MNETLQPIGRTSATEREAITSDKFAFWLPDEVIVNPFDIVAVDQVNQPGEAPTKTYGLVTMLEHRTDAPNHLANFISSNFGQLEEEPNTNRQGTTVANVNVLSNNADIYMPVPSERLVSFADAEGIQQALGTDVLVRERKHDAIPAGLIRMSNGATAVAYLDRRYVMGPESAHVNISGISGLATKTSYAMFLLQSILQTAPDKGNIAVIILNVKQADLLQVDQRGPELPPHQKALWEAMNLEPKPFETVRYLLPRGEKGSPNSFSPVPSIYTLFAYDLPGTADKLDLLFSNIADTSGTVEGIYGEIKEILVNNEPDAKSLQSWEGLLEYLRNKAADKGRWRGMFASSSIGMFRRHLRRLVQTRQTGLFVDSRSRNEKLLADELVNIKGGTTYVVDIAKLGEDEQTLVFGDILRTIYAVKALAAENRTEKGAVPEKVIIFVDELNKYAPGGSKESPITTQVLDVAERGRSLGVILISAQQFMSAVHSRVTGNSASKIIGRTGSSEANASDYRFLDQDIRNAVTRLGKGELLVSHAIYRQPVKVIFPWLSVQTGTELMPTYSPTELEAFVRQRGPEIATEIKRAATQSRNEADLVAQVERILERFERNFDVSLNLQRERTLINGRADAVYNRFVIEYEPPGSLRKSNEYRHNQHAIGQVKQYMDGLERLDRHKKERLAGAVLDGSFFVFVRHRDDHWRIDDPVPVNAQSTETFLRYLLSLSTELALTPENLVRDFGENSNVARQVVPILYHALSTTSDPKTRILFDQWRRQFSEITGYEKGSVQLDAGKLAKSYAVTDRAPDAEQLFFALHTYYATFIKLLAVQIATYYLMPQVGSGLTAVANEDSVGLRNYLVRMERGGVFADFGIKNFLEGDFFGWYLDIWDTAIEGTVRRLVSELANYSLVTLDVDPEETRDLLKQLYQNLMPRKLRHALGEYYTPDWLAERLLNQLCGGPEKGLPAMLAPEKRLLDPACGSGTFLVLAIKRVKAYSEEKMLNEGRVLEQVLENIVGFDLNPLAVITARTNYLLALGELLPHRRSEISIPVYLADSILTPSLETSATGQLSLLDDSGTRVKQPGYTFGTAVGKFTVPQTLTEARYIDQLTSLLEDCINSDLTWAQFTRRLLNTFPLRSDQDAAEIDLAVQLFERLQTLHQQGIDGIWARIIKNAFAPVFQGQFDYVAGNPPWVNWMNLPEEYRNSSIPLWNYYRLFPHRGLKARLGGAMDDISVLMTYVSVDKYLKSSGRLGFLITQSVFKTSGGGKGFRSFRISDHIPLKVVSVDDMVELQPFEGASTQTAIIVVEKGKPTEYPVQYTLWRKKPDSGNLALADSLLDVINTTSRYEWVGAPVLHSDLTSQWLTGRRAAVDAIRRVLGQSQYVARHGVHSWRSAIYWLEKVGTRPDGLIVVSNMTSQAKAKVDSVQAVMESELIYPMVRGGDVFAWGALPSCYTLVPQDPDDPSKGYPEDRMAVELPKTYAYLKHFESELANRSGYKKYLEPSGNPFYSIYNVGPYTFAPYKVVWANIASEIAAAVISSIDTSVIVPEHVVTMVGLTKESEAHYLCAMLNSSPANFAVQSYSTRGGKSFGTPHVLENVKVPPYNPSDPLHHKLAKCSQEAHRHYLAGELGKISVLETEIDALAAQIWGLSEAQLYEIEKSLVELA